MSVPLMVWGDVRQRTSFTVELFPVHDLYSSLPVEQVLVYTASFEEALKIATREAIRFRLEPRRQGSKRVN